MFRNSTVKPKHEEEFGRSLLSTVFVIYCARLPLSLSCVFYPISPLSKFRVPRIFTPCCPMTNGLFTLGNLRHVERQYYCADRKKGTFSFFRVVFKFALTNFTKSVNNLNRTNCPADSQVQDIVAVRSK